MPSRGHRCDLTILDESQARPDLDRKAIQTVVDAVLAEEGRDRALLTVLLVDDAGSARLHGEHFNDPTATDVMTFPDGTTDPESGLVHLGDLAICVPVARRVARERGRRERDEITLYVLHGVLHLMGYDDADERDQLEMWAVQRRVLGLVGIALESDPG